MKYIVGLIVGLIVGIFLYILWKKIFGKYLPPEDSFLLKFICATGHAIGGLFNGCLIVTKNRYAIVAGLILILLVMIVSYSFGVYYRVVFSKKIQF